MGRRWHPPGRRRANGKIVDCPPAPYLDTIGRGLRMLEIENGAAVQRNLSVPLFDDNPTVYLSFILSRDATLNDQSSFQFLIGDASGGRPTRRRNNGVGFGITSNGFPFLKNGGVIDEVGESRL